MRNGQDWWFGSTYFARFRVPKPGRLNLTSISGIFRSCLNVRMWCQVEMMRAKKKLTEEKKTYEELKAQKCLQHTHCQSKGTTFAWKYSGYFFRYMDIAHHSATCSSNCCDMHRMQIHGKSRVTRPVLFPCESRQSLAFQEKVKARLKNPSPSSEERQVHHVMSCHATTSINKPYQPSDTVWRQEVVRQLEVWNGVKLREYLWRWWILCYGQEIMMILEELKRQKIANADMEVFSDRKRIGI